MSEVHILGLHTKPFGGNYFLSKRHAKHPIITQTYVGDLTSNNLAANLCNKCSRLHRKNRGNSLFNDCSSKLQAQQDLTPPCFSLFHLHGVFVLYCLASLRLSVCSLAEKGPGLRPERPFIQKPPAPRGPKSQKTASKPEKGSATKKSPEESPKLHNKSGEKQKKRQELSGAFLGKLVADLQRPFLGEIFLRSLGHFLRGSSSQG